MRPQLLIPVLSVGLLVSWGSLYYAFAVLAAPMQKDLHYSAEVLTGAFSVALLMWGVATYFIGPALDRWGARRIMILGSIIAAAGFAGLHSVDSVWTFYLLWSALGAAMAMTLYEPAFALVVQTFHEGSKRYIAWLAIVGGLASTIFWPLSSYLNALFGWRDTLLAFAVLHLLIGLVLRCIRLPQEQHSLQTRPSGPAFSLLPLQPAHRSALAQLSMCFAIYGFITALMMVQVIPLLESRGFDSTAALGLAACIGPMQVAGRALDLVFGDRLGRRPLGVTTLNLMSVSLAALWLAQWMPVLNIVFVITFGMSLGLLTVVRAATPLALFGAARYGANSGILGAPALLARAAGPITATLLLDAFGNHSHVLLVLLLISLLGRGLYAQAWSLPGAAE